MKRIFGFVLVFILTAPAIPLAAVTMTSYFPLHTGNSWTYQILEYPMTITETILSGTVDINGANAKILESSQGIREYFTNDTNGIRKHRNFYPADLLFPGAAVTLTFVPPFVYSYAQMDVGMQVSTNGIVDAIAEGLGQATLNFQGTSTFEGFEIVTVPAGTFATIRLKAIGETWGTIGGESFYLQENVTVWFANNIGLIKQVVVITLGVDTDTQTYLLTSTNIHIPSANLVDFNGDRKTDIAIYRPSTGSWFIIPSSTGVAYGVAWGGSTDIPVPGDYDGDRKSDIAIYHPETGSWFIIPSSTGVPYGVAWGSSTDIPVPGDYDGDGKKDIAIFHPNTGSWFIIPSSTGVPYGVAWGSSTDIPVPGDYDGDGKTDIAIFHPGTGSWFIIPSSTGVPYGVAWGSSTDIPVPGDYDGDGKTDIAIFHPSTGSWFIIPSSTGVAYGVAWGSSTDKPVPGDYDGDGKTDIAIYHPDTGSWFVIPSFTGVAYGVAWGSPTDIPLTQLSFRNR